MKKLLFLLMLLAVPALAEKRYYLVPIIGTGADGDDFRPDINPGFSYSAIIPSKPDGTPRFNWALVIISGADQTALLSNSKMKQIPKVNMNTLISSLSNPVKNAIQNALIEKGIDLSVYTSAVTVGDLIENLGKYLEPQFRLGGIDVSE